MEKDFNFENQDIYNLIAVSVFPNSFILNGTIPLQQRMLFKILCSYDFADDNGKRKGWCYPSLDRVTEQMGIDKRATQIHLKRLVECGLVTIIYRNNCNKDNSKTSIYVLNILPGLSEEDRSKIALFRDTEIKNLISGLNTIKVQTTKGMQYISKEEFDLEFLVTGKRSSQVIMGELDSPDEAISGDSELKLGFKSPKLSTKITDIKNFNSEDIIKRIKSGNYNNVQPNDVCEYFKRLYETKYPGEAHILGNHIKRKMTELMKSTELDLLIPLIEFFIERYDKLFYSVEYPRPQIFQLTVQWIWDKLYVSYMKSNSAKIEMQIKPTEDSEEKVVW